MPVYLDSNGKATLTAEQLAGVVPMIKDAAAPTTTQPLSGTLLGTGVLGLNAATGQYHSTAPTKTNATVGPVEQSVVGDMRVSADLYDFLHQTHLVVAGTFTRAPLAVPCDGIWTDVDGAVVYGQPRGRPYPIVDGLTFADATKWSGANWTVSGNKATHTAGATTALTATMSTDRPLVIGKRYAFVIKVSGVGAGSVTIYAGATAGTSRSSNGTFVEVISVATSTGVTVVPSSDFDGSVEILQAYQRSPKLRAYGYMPFAMAEIVGIAASSAMGTLLAASDSVEVHACYRRVPGAADLG